MATEKKNHRKSARHKPGIFNLLGYIMKPAARIQACIDIIDAVLNDTSIPADNLLTAYFRSRRYIGSHDRKAIAEGVYQALRHKILLEAIWQKITSRSKVSGRQLMITGLAYLQKNEDMAHLFSGQSYSPSPLTQDEQKTLNLLRNFSLDTLEGPARHNLQAWQYQELNQQYGSDLSSLLAALNAQASFDLRVNTLVTTRATVQARLEQEGISSEAGHYSPTALRLRDRRPLGKHPLWTEGCVEVQDEGSQLIAYLVDAKPGQWVWDYCAGAGGKTLALAALMLNQGRLLATDTVDWRLQRSRERFKRAQVYNVECQVLNEASHKWVKRQGEKFDRVLIDVPCSGSGTWRRNPDLKWRAEKSDFQTLKNIQAQILEKAARLVKPGGRLIYSTCSLFAAENEDQINAFLKENLSFSLVPIPSLWPQVLPGPCPTTELMLQLRPDLHHVDGFFIAVMQKSPAVND